MSRIVLRSALLLALALALAGCSVVPGDPALEEGSEETTAQPSAEPAMPSETDFSYLNGVWLVEATLTDIDEGAMREAAELPSKRWECVVDGTEMTLVTDSHTYTGTIAPELDSGWVFVASASFEDEDGESWSHELEVHGKRMGEAIFAGGMELSVDSASSGHQYAASWDIEGRRP